MSAVPAVPERDFIPAVPEREFKGLDYSNDKVDEYRSALDSGVNINSRDCKNSSPIDFLYLSTIRGGRKTKKMSASGLMTAGGCGCGLTGGVRYRKRRSNRVYGGGGEGEDMNDISYPNSGEAKAAEAEPGAEPGYPNSGEAKAAEAAEPGTGAGDPAMTGGCFTCKKGVKNITHIYSTIHIIIPTLYSKYKKGVSLKPVKPAKAAKAKSPAKAAKAKSPAKAAKAKSPKKPKK